MPNISESEDYSRTRSFSNSSLDALGSIASIAPSKERDSSCKINSEQILNKNLVSESKFFRSSSQFFHNMGIGAGVLGISTGAASMYVTGAIAVGLSTAGIGFGVIGAIFLLIALIEYVRSRKAEKSEVEDRPLVSPQSIPNEWPESVSIDEDLTDEEIISIEKEIGEEENNDGIEEWNN